MSRVKPLGHADKHNNIMHVKINKNPLTLVMAI